MTGYLLDANVFIQSQNAHYSLDLAPGFWDFLDKAWAAGDVSSIEAVFHEVVPTSKAAYDDLASWVAVRRHMFAPVDVPALQVESAIAAWLVQPGSRFTKPAVARFLDGADPRLVAYAKAHGLTVVTHEVSSPESRTKVKIPDVCAEFGVPCVNPFELMRALGAKLVLA